MDQPTYQILLIEAFDHLEVTNRWQMFQLSDWLSPEFDDKEEWRKIESFEMETVPDRSTITSWKTYLEQPETQEFLRKFDLIILVTVGRRPQWFAKALTGHRYWLVLHNLADWRGRPLALNSPRALLSYARERWHIAAKKQLLANAERVVVPLESMLPLAREIAGPNRPLWLPFASTNIKWPWVEKLERPEPEAVTPFRVLVPGKVTDQLKDYRQLAEALKQYPVDGPALEIILAGRLAEHKWKELLERVPGPFTIRSWEHGLTSKQFSNQLGNTHLVLAPLHQRRQRGPYWETTGLTRTSGAVFDAIAMGKLLLTPDWHPILGKSHQVYGSTEELTAILLARAKEGFVRGEWPEFNQQLWRERWLSAIRKPLEG